MSTFAVPPVRRAGANGSRRGPSRRRPAQPPVRLTRRGRVVVVAFLVLVALASSFLGLRNASVATSRQGRPPYRTVVVQPGQTLWDVAREAAPGADPRDTVGRIMEVNDLSSALVQPGQQIAVPARQ
jgi:hypothetical protein